MASSQVYQMWNDALGAHQKRNFELFYIITGAKTGKFLAPGPQAIVGYDAGDFTQAACDALLGSSSEFVTATAFGSTAMGTDAFGWILNMGTGQSSGPQGQAAYSSLGMCKIIANIGGTVSTLLVQTTTAALPNTLAAPARVQVGSSGNLAGQVVVSGLDAATAGFLKFEFSIPMK